MMMYDIIHPEVNNYLDSLLSPVTPIFNEMEHYATERSFPIVGPQVGRFLFQITYLRKPKSIFEIGSGFGYSTLWFCLAAPETQVICTEYDQDNIKLAKNWLDKAGFIENIEFIHGSAQKVLKESRNSYDIIFNDADKRQYPEIFSMAVKNLNKGGLLISDNVLWKGKIINTNTDDIDTKGVQKYNKLLFNTPGIFSSIVVIRDGISISIKMK
jgi:predicted O-methyltransferase YrrM